MYVCICRSQWPRGLRSRPAAARLLRSWVRIPPRAWMFVCCEYCVLSGRGLCDELIIRPEESYRLWCVVVCDLETSRMRRPWPALGCSATGEIYIYIYIYIYISPSYLSCSWTTCWPVPVSRIQKSLQRSAIIPSASWGIVFHYPG